MASQDQRRKRTWPHYCSALYGATWSDSHGYLLSMCDKEEKQTQKSWESFTAVPVEIAIDTVVATRLASSKPRVIHLELVHYKTYHMDIGNPIKTLPHLLVSRSVFLSFSSTSPLLSVKTLCHLDWIYWGRLEADTAKIQPEWVQWWGNGWENTAAFSTRICKRPFQNII